MERNQGNQGGQAGRTTTGGQDRSSHGLGNLDQDELRRGAQEGGETSSHEQSRDDQGQFAGKSTDKGTGSVRGGFSQGQGGNQGQGGSHSGGQGGSHGGGQGRTHSGGQGNQGGSSNR